jgi:dolichyl-phosphate beta-glucosyltransferase
MKRIIQFVLSLAFGGLVLWAVLRRFDLRQTLASVHYANPRLFAMGFLLMVIAYLVRGARWRIWERSLSFWDSLRLILIGFMGNNVLPARLGEILRAHCASAKIVHERGRTAALASIAAERILDGLILAVFGVVGVEIGTLNGQMRLGLLLVCLLFAGLASALVLGIRYHTGIRSFIAATNRKFPGHVTRFVKEKANHFLDGLLPLGPAPRMISALTLTAVIWTLEVGSCYLMGLSVWSGMSAHTALLFLVVVNFASLIPLTIGGIGTIESVALAFLVNSGLSAYLALAMILLQHASQYFFTTISGGILYFTGGFYRVSLSQPKAAGQRPTQPAPASATAETVFNEIRSSLGQLSRVVELRPAPPDDVQLSIVIPAYNEQSRLPRTVLETIRWCTSQHLTFELILADDGSRDATLALAHLFEESDVRIRALACPHMGKGATVRMGMLNARGQYVLFMDADGATPLTEIPKLVAAIESGYDVAIGSRIMQAPGEVEIKTPLHRKIIGRVFAFFVNLFAIEGIGDTQCGFKMFRRAAARAICSRQKMTGFSFDVEQLFLARRLSLTIAEIPVNWVAQPGSKVNLVADSIKMLWDISLIRGVHRNFQPAHAISPIQDLHRPLNSGSEIS